MASSLVKVLALIQSLYFVKGQLGSPLTTSSVVGLPGAIAEGIARTTEPCVAMGMALQNGACRAYNEDVSGNNDYLQTTNCAALQQAVASRRPPSADCCNDVRRFVTSGCACNPALLSQARMMGIADATVISTARSGQVACGSVFDPCTNTYGCGRT
eukprot:jgi/Botrbrau1/19465/Bobra.0338s0085.1